MHHSILVDIQNRADIILLVNNFYHKIKSDPIIGFIFTDVAKINWEMHLPKMYDFWENILFHTGNFDGNPMHEHQKLHRKYPLTIQHFHHWNKLFNETVDTLFLGPKAEEIKQRAMHISSVIQIKTLAS